MQIEALHSSAHHVIAATAQAFGMRPEQLLGEGRSAPVALARHAAVWLLRTELHLSWQAITHGLQRVHHGAAMNSFKRARHALDTDPPFAAAVKAARRQLQAAHAPDWQI